MVSRNPCTRKHTQKNTHTPKPWFVLPDPVMMSVQVRVCPCLLVSTRPSLSLDRSVPLAIHSTYGHKSAPHSGGVLTSNIRTLGDGPHMDLSPPPPFRGPTHSPRGGQLTGRAPPLLACVFVLVCFFFFFWGGGSVSECVCVSVWFSGAFLCVCFLVGWEGHGGPPCGRTCSRKRLSPQPQKLPL